MAMSWYAEGLPVLVGGLRLLIPFFLCVDSIHTN